MRAAARLISEEADVSERSRLSTYVVTGLAAALALAAALVPAIAAASGAN